MNKKLIVMLALVIAFAMLFTACSKDNTKKDEPKKVDKSDDHSHDHDHDHDDEASINDWEGTWNNMGAYLDDAEVQEGFEKLAEKEGITVEEAIKNYKAKRDCEFDGLVIADGKVTFLDGFKDKDGKEIETVEYEFVESVKTMHGNFELQWDVFKAKGDAKYPVLLMMPVHGEESLTHFHMRYGKDKDELMGKDGWYPTFVKPSSTYEQLVDEIAE
ncbi:MAG: ZinT/AdcA family metal-binding protein [Tissierellia bacterium]|nr:ZinT/AdcA family metal-binding protein [Tissierellia bacterium]